MKHVFEGKSKNCHYKTFHSTSDIHIGTNIHSVNSLHDFRKIKKQEIDGDFMTTKKKTTSEVRIKK